MKKILFLSLVILTALTTWGDAKVKSGTMRNLKNADTRVLVTWDYSKMLIEDKSPEAFLAEKGSDWQKDYAAEVAASESAFTTKFNKKNKKYALITDDEDAAQYEMIIHVDKLHYGSTAVAVIFGGFGRGAHLEGTIDVVDTATKTVVCNIKFDCSGEALLGNEARRVSAYEDLAEDVAKLVSKAKNK